MALDDFSADGRPEAGARVFAVTMTLDQDLL
jgi:hypothetical protein